MYLFQHARIALRGVGTPFGLAVDAVRPDVDGVMTKSNEPGSHDRRKGVVDQKLTRP